MTSYFNACDVTVANSNLKNVLWFLELCPLTLKKVPPPMIVGDIYILRKEISLSMPYVELDAPELDEKFMV